MTKEMAIQTANYVTYYLQPDKRIVVGFEYNQWWYSCHIGVIYYLFDFVSLGLNVKQVYSANTGRCT